MTTVTVLKPIPQDELDRINVVVVTVDDLFALNDSIQRLEAAGGADSGFPLIGAATTHMRTEDHGVSLIARYVALIDFMKRNDDSPWIARERADGEALASASLFAAAAGHPVVDRDGEFAFDTPSFLDRVLRLAGGPDPV